MGRCLQEYWLLILILPGYFDIVSGKTTSGIIIHQQEEMGESTNHPLKSNIKKRPKTACSLFRSDHESRGGLWIPQSTRQRLWVWFSSLTVLGQKLFLFTSVLPSFTFNPGTSSLGTQTQGKNKVLFLHHSLHVHQCTSSSQLACTSV